MTRHVVYLLADRQGRGYVGQTRALDRRVQQHRCRAAAGDRRAVYRWLRELTVTGEPLLVRTLEVCWSTESANAAERRWIARCQAEGMALQNSSRGGQRAYGPEHGETVAVALARPESRARKAAATRRRHKAGFMSEESKQRMAEGQRASWTEEREAAARARWADPEWRARTLANQRRALDDPEVRARMSEVQRRTKGTPENRERVRQQTRRQWADPVKRAEISAAISATHSTPEQRARMSQQTAALWQDPEHREKVARGQRTALERRKAKEAEHVAP